MFPKTTVLACIVHLCCGISWTSSREGPRGRGRGAEGHLPGGRRRREAALAAFEDGLWGRRYPAIGKNWRQTWSEVVPFCAFRADVRQILYTTNAIEALNAKLRRAVRGRGHFPTAAAAIKLLLRILNHSEKEWKMPPREWMMVSAQFAVLFGGRFTSAMAA
ncbi:transposase-like protein [Inquilinus ginsengisoli]|uniref:transposase n=1 Tax=Inquilinus ginsengisoli TaxID=363840 RepID=UPI003D20EB8F